MGEIINTICWIAVIVWAIYIINDERKNQQ